MNTFIYLNCCHLAYFRSYRCASSSIPLCNALWLWPKLFLFPSKYYSIVPEMPRTCSWARSALHPALPGTGHEAHTLPTDSLPKSLRSAVLRSQVCCHVGAQTLELHVQVSYLAILMLFRKPIKVHLFVLCSQYCCFFCFGFFLKKRKTKKERGGGRVGGEKRVDYLY